MAAANPSFWPNGYLVNIESWWVERGIIAELAKTHRVIAFDHRGHGKSGKPHDRAQYGPEMGQDIVRLMDHLQLPKAHIMGYSMGSHVVAQLVTKNPERFLTMTLGGAAGRFDWTTEEQKRVDIEAAEMDEGLGTSMFLRLWPRDQPKPSIEEAKAISIKRLQGMDTKALAAVRRSNADQVVTLAQMGIVKVPTLGIVGTADPYQKDFEKMKAVLPQMKLVMIEGASHASAPTLPEFIKAVKEFLSLHPGGTTN